MGIDDLYYLTFHQTENGRMNLSLIENVGMTFHRRENGKATFSQIGGGKMKSRRSLVSMKVVSQNLLQIKC